MTRGWRVVDIVVASTLAAALAVVLVVWNGVYGLATPLAAAFPPALGVLYGVYLLPGVLVGLVIRRPGAALLGGVVSAAVSMLLGSPWGLSTLLSGLVQGLGAEIGFALSAYRAWNVVAAILAGLLAGVLAAGHDLVVWLPFYPLDWKVAFAVLLMLSGAVAGAGAWLLVRALAATGVLAAFPAGRAQERV